jgi:1,4-alpha-glucan branching enzyme
VLEYPNHRGIQEVVKSLNKLYKNEPALYEKAFEGSGFEWIDGGNSVDSILIYTRKGFDPKNDLVIILNMTPNPHHGYRVGVPDAGSWKEIFNSDEKQYWGSGLDNPKAVKSEHTHWHGRDHSISVNLPPLGASVFKKAK